MSSPRRTGRSCSRRANIPHRNPILRWNELCKTYWFPLYAYLRRHGHTKEDAEDLTQAFFARFLAKNFLEGLSAERGRFLVFLLASLKHFLANEWDKSRRLKRGGGEAPLSLDWQTADTKFLNFVVEMNPGFIDERSHQVLGLGSIFLILQRGVHLAH